MAADPASTLSATTTELVDRNELEAQLFQNLVANALKFRKPAK